MMKWHLMWLLCIASAAQADEWKPPENPDPQLILQQARNAAGAGRFEDALAMHVWFHQNALKYNRSLYGVRLSFALSDWLELGKAYPPALAKLQELRDVALQDVMNGKNLHISFHDLTAMNRALGEPERTKDAFVALEAKHPDRAKEVYALAQPELVAAKAYELCGKYLNPKSSFPLMLAQYRTSDALAKDPKFGASMRDFAQKQFSNSTTTLIALLVLNERQQEADEVARDARKEWDDKQFHAAIDKALEGKLPAAWP